MWAGLEVRLSEDHSKTDEGGEDIPPARRKGGRTKAGGVKQNVAAKAVKEHKKKIESGDVVKMSYVKPGEECSKIKHMTLRMPAEQVKELWLALHEESETEFTATEMEAFHRCLGIHLSSLFNIDFTKLSLVQISLPFFQAHQSGHIRIEAEEHVKVVLRYLTELCEGDMLCADPTLSVQSSDNVT